MITLDSNSLIVYLAHLIDFLFFLMWNLLKLINNFSVDNIENECLTRFHRSYSTFNILFSLLSKFQYLCLSEIGNYFFKQISKIILSFISESRKWYRSSMGGEVKLNYHKKKFILYISWIIGNFSKKNSHFQ